MIEIVFATNNNHKLEEIRDIAGGMFRISGLREAGLEGEIPEEADDLAGNALEKARYVHRRLGVSCFADDTGLEVDALGGKPGVKSARYAGDGCIAENNIRKLLEEMTHVRDRRARFRTVIALILDGNEYLFEGVIRGEIMTEKHGQGGFGYDPVFRPDGYGLTFGEMPSREKNRISHRAVAVGKLIEFLRRQAQFQ